MPIYYFLGLSAFMFVIGFLGVLTRRNALVIFMSLEMMFNSANLVFVTFAAYYQSMVGQLSVFFVMTVAAAEVAVGLALMVEIFRTKHSIDVDQMSNLKG
ncbi:MAG: NADH-quinone oxidoreductase subunit NuoK [Chloroflexi bacterium]|jgi:NADH-quinone oxidoreductase subunit K|nr:NADH-quinone oxidoreductase subunit NuoK [Anaerolineaceae bacterium]NMB90010.1 NADH-quinone oxidoreductase subunit NuoK [Chloroflexota bacterium]